MTIDLQLILDDLFTLDGEIADNKLQEAKTSLRNKIFDID